MKLISTYNVLERRTVYDCRIKSLTELMRHYGMILSAYEVMLIARSVAFSYDVISIPEIYEGELPFAVVSNNTIEECFFESLGIQFYKEKIGNSQDDWDYMKNIINEDKPILFRIDSRFLNGQQESIGKLNLYYVSTLLLVGYDDQNENVLVVLTNTDEKDTVTELSYEEFQKYRQTNCVPYNPDFICYYLADDNDVSSISSEKIREAVISGLKHIVDDMFCKKHFKENRYGAFVGTIQAKGFEGMHELAEDLERLVLDYNQGEDIVRKIIKFNRVFLRNNLLFGSHTAFRYEFAGCLNACCEKYGFHSFYKYSEKMKRIGSRWLRFFGILSGIAHSNEDATCKIQEAIISINEIIQEEKEVFDCLQQDLKLSINVC